AEKLITRAAAILGWTRRTAATYAIAAALNIPATKVDVTDDGDRLDPGDGSPGDLIMVTDPATGVLRMFIRHPAERSRWLLLDHCIDCNGVVPVAAVATRADLSNPDLYDH